MHTFHLAYEPRTTAPTCSRRCGLTLGEHPCLVGSATDQPCPNMVSHVSGSCGEHAPRVCSKHPWDDGRDGFCGECLDEYQSNDYTPMPPVIAGIGFVLVGPAYN